MGYYFGTSACLQTWNSGKVGNPASVDAGTSNLDNECDGPREEGKLSSQQEDKRDFGYGSSIAKVLDTPRAAIAFPHVVSNCAPIRNLSTSHRILKGSPKTRVTQRE